MRILFIFCPRYPAALFLLLLCLCNVGLLQAQSLAEKFPMFQAHSPINPAVENGLARLLSCRDRAVPLPDLEELAPMLEYMIMADGGLPGQHPAERPEGVGVYWKNSINKNFTDTLRYYFNPAISSELLFPASIRLGKWLPGSDILRLDTPLWKKLDKPATGLVALRGEEYEQITPDDFSGSYYGYKQDRLLLLFRYKGLPMLLSVYWQNGESETGRKAWFLGDYNNWDFVFTTESGGAATGLGWLSTNMYRSCCVMLFYPQDEGHTGYAIFKWLAAGWNGINMVRASHILSGADRSFAGMQIVIDKDRGLRVEELEEIERLAGNSDRAGLVERTMDYSVALDRQSRSDSMLRRSEFQTMLESGNYARRLGDDELRALVKVNELKRRLGRAVLGD